MPKVPEPGAAAFRSTEHPCPPTPPPPPLPPGLPSPVREARQGAACPWTSSDGPPGHRAGWEGAWVAGANKGILLNEPLKHSSCPLQNEVTSSKPECTRDSQVGFSLTLGILSISGKPTVHHPEDHSMSHRPPGNQGRIPSAEREPSQCPWARRGLPGSGGLAKKEQAKEWPLRASWDRELRAVTWSRAAWCPPAAGRLLITHRNRRAWGAEGPPLIPTSCQSLRAQKGVPSVPLLA